jgi:hypothetical protein
MKPTSHAQSAPAPVLVDLPSRASGSRWAALALVVIAAGIMALSPMASATMAARGGTTVPATPTAPHPLSSLRDLLTANHEAQFGPSPVGPRPLQTFSYGGGPVQHNPKVYLFWWAPAGTAYDDAADLGALNPSTAHFQNGVASFITNLNQSVYMGNLQQYTDNLGSPGMDITLAGQIYDTDPYPNQEGSFSSPILDSDIQSELGNWITQHEMPTGINNTYMVLFPLGVYVEVSGLEGGILSGIGPYDWCGYANDFTLGTNPVVYNVYPDPGTNLDSCAPTLQFTSPYTEDYMYPYGPSGSNFLDGQLNLIAWYLGWAITDPLYSSGWTYNEYGYLVDVGIVCAWRYFGAQPYDDNANFEFAGTPYFVQPLFNNTAGGCLSGPLNAPPSPTPAVGPIDVGWSGSVETGQQAWITVTDSNNGASAAGMNLTIGLPPATILSSIVVSSTFPSVTTVVAPLTVVTGCYDLCTLAPGTPVVEVNDTNWASSVSYTVNVTFAVSTAENSNITVESAGVPAGLGPFAVWSPTSGPLDAIGQYATQYPIAITPGPQVGVPFPDHVSGDVGQSVWFNATLWSAGAGGVSYHWTQSAPGLGCGASVSLDELCKPTAAGTYRTTIFATDLATGWSSNTSAAFTVFPDPSALAPVASKGSVDVGQSVMFTGNVGGPGSGSDTYAWSSTPSGLGCAASGAATVWCTPGKDATYQVSFWVTDSNGITSSGTSAFTVYADPAALVVQPGTPSADVGQGVTFTASVPYAGSGGLTYAWTPSSISFGCGAATGPSYTCVPAAPGTYTVDLKVTDSNDGNGTAVSLPYTIYPLPQVAEPFTQGGVGPQVGTPITFWTSLLVQGSGGDIFTWDTPSALGCSAATSDNITCTPQTAGSYTITVTATDSDHGSGSATTPSVSVAGSLTLAASSSVTSGAAPLQVAFQAVVSGGVAPYSYVWHFGDGAQDASPLPNPTWTYTTAGTFVASVFVNDSAGHSVEHSITITVSAQVVQSNPLGFLPGGLFDLLLILLVVVLMVVLIYLTNKHRKHALEHEQGAAGMAGWDAGAAQAAPAAQTEPMGGSSPTDSGMGSPPPTDVLPGPPPPPPAA